MLHCRKGFLRYLSTIKLGLIRLLLYYVNITFITTQLHMAQSTENDNHISALFKKHDRVV